MRGCCAYRVGGVGREIPLPPSQATDKRSHHQRARRREPAGFELLRAKLDVPPRRPGLVERTRIVQRLAQPRSGRVVSVVAPPGYGKTTALGQWAATDGRPFAWLSLDRRDNDPVLLLTYVAEALNADGAVGPSVFKAISSDSLWSKGLPRLGAALASRQEPLVLVLDDVHELESHDCLDALVALLPHVPSGSQIVFSGRTEAPLGLPEAARRGRAARARACHPRAQRRGGACSPRRRRRRCDRRRGARPQRPRGGLGSRALSRRSVGRQRRLVAVVAPWRRPLLDRLPALGGARARRSGRGRVPAEDVGARPDVRAALRRGARAPRFVSDTRATRAGQPVRRRARPRAPLVPLPPPLPRDAPGRAGAARAGARRHAQRAGGRVVRGERAARGRDRVRRGGGRPGRARVTRHGERVPLLPGRPGNDRRALVGDVRRRGAPPAIPGHRRLRGAGSTRCGGVPTRPSAGRSRRRTPATTA